MTMENLQPVQKDINLESEGNKKIGDKALEIAIESMIQERINDNYSNLSYEEKERYSKRLKVIFNGIVEKENIELENEDGVVGVMDRAAAILEEEVKKEKGPKKYEGDYVVEKGVVDINTDKFKTED